VAADPRRYFRPPYVGGRGWVGVYLDVPGAPVDWAEVAELVGEAYRVVAPRRLVARLDAGPGAQDAAGNAADPAAPARRAGGAAAGGAQGR
jgi:hypothetical protein